MNIGIIQLEAYDTLNSIRERISWEENQCFVLVLPSQVGLNLGPLDLKLLLRYAETRGQDFGLVTREADICEAARLLGIPFFLSVDDVEKDQWPTRKPSRLIRRSLRPELRSFRKNLPVTELFNFIQGQSMRVAIFAVGVLAVLAIVLVLIPTADVHIDLPEKKQISIISVSADQTAAGVQISGLVPLRQLQQTLEGSASALASGSVLQPDQPATGQVLLLNLTDKAVFVPAKTILLTSLVPSVSFLTEKSIEVPVGKGKTVNVPIRAALAGPDGNVEPGTVTLFDGALGSQLSVINLAPISGGTLVTVAMATDQDRENLRKRLLADLQRQALTVFAGQVSEGDILFPATITRLRVIEESFIPATEKAGEKISLTMRVEYRISFVANSDLRLLGELVSDASIPAGSLAASDQIDLTPVSGYQEGQGIVRWQMRVERNLQPQVDANQVVSLVQGKTRGEASQNLTRVFDLELQPRIEIHPVWWPWLPFLPVRIAVKG